MIRFSSMFLSVFEFPEFPYKMNLYYCDTHSNHEPELDVFFLSLDVSSNFSKSCASYIRNYLRSTILNLRLVPDSDFFVLCVCLDDDPHCLKVVLTTL